MRIRQRRQVVGEVMELRRNAEMKVDTKRDGEGSGGGANELGWCAETGREDKEEMLVSGGGSNE